MLKPLTQWTWVWAGSGSWWWTGKSGMLQSMGSQRVGHYWATELNWTESLWLCGSWQTVENSLRDGNTSHLTCLLRNLYAGQEATIRTGHGTMDWFQIGKGVCQGCILSPCLFNLYAEYLMLNAGLDEAQAGIKIARRNTNNLRYADDTTLMAESKEELKSLLMRVKEESETADLKLNIQKTKIMASGSITSWQNNENSDRFYFPGLQNHCRWWLQPWN